MSIDLVGLLAVTIGVGLGNSFGRLLWVQRRVLLSPWAVIAVLAISGLITLRAFQMLGIYASWQSFFFPLLVGWGAGLSITPARLPKQSAWWEIWKE
ncbi:MAG TPA: hypothetical protein VMW65_11850 [Chloroflexota bacterium]|nr:hypothetical protein [Chloroflexota bacterium]